MSRVYVPGHGWTNETNQGATMTSTTLTRDVIDRAYVGLSSKLNGITLEQVYAAVRRAGGIDGSIFPTLEAESVALAAVAQAPELYLTPCRSEADAAEAVAAIVGGNPDMRWDFAKTGKALNPTAYTNPESVHQQVAAAVPSEAQAATIVRLSGVSLTGKVPDYGTKVMSRAEYAAQDVDGLKLTQTHKADHTHDCKDCDDVQCPDPDHQVARLLRAHAAQTPAGPEKPQSPNHVHPARR